MGCSGLDGPEAHAPVRELERGRRQDLRPEIEGEDRPRSSRPRQAVGEPAVRDAEARGGTDPNKQISEFIGSGPFVFKTDEWKPGDKAVYVRFDKYKPRPEPPSGLAGGKVVKVDRVEWRAISDQQQAVNALLAGEIDFIEQPPHDLHALLEADANIKMWTLNPLGSLYFFRPNHLNKPFDDPEIRSALWYALNQEDFLRAAIGDAEHYKVCRSQFICGTRLESAAGMDGLLTSNFEKARAVLKDAGYDGTPIVLMHSTDLHVLANVAPVAKQLMEKAGFKVDMQSMDMQTMVARRAKRDPIDKGGWHAFITSPTSLDGLDPIMASTFNGGCEKGWPGWPCDAEMERLRDTYARETIQRSRRHSPMPSRCDRSRSPRTSTSANS